MSAFEILSRHPALSRIAPVVREVVAGYTTAGELRWLSETSEAQADLCIAAIKPVTASLAP